MHERTYFCPPVSAVCTQYPNRNRFLAGLYTPHYIADYVSQPLLDIPNGEERSVVIVDFNCVKPVIDHDKKFSSIRYMRWRLRTQRVTVRPRDARSIENLEKRLLKPQPWGKIR